MAMHDMQYEAEEVEHEVKDESSAPEAMKKIKTALPRHYNCLQDLHALLCQVGAVYKPSKAPPGHMERTLSKFLERVPEE